MKLSLAWIMAHIQNVDWRTLDLPALVAKFNQTTAEIEAGEGLKLEAQRFTLVSASVDSFYSPELQKTLTLPARVSLLAGQYYLAYQPALGATEPSDSGWRWATVKDLGGSKDSLLPAFSCAEQLKAGGWKEQISWEDHILEFDNKSLTHRPDLWGHRGIAREIAALYNWELRPLAALLQVVPTQDLKQSLVSGCHKISTCLITDLSPSASDLALSFQLARVEQKPINLLVDLTNYVMLDLGQPMHAFDAARLVDQQIAVRFAQAGEKLTLLDQQTVTLTPEDLVIASGEQPVSLAGIMGGQSTGISPATTSVLLEAATWSAGTIRRTATRLKIRTEASLRYEKSLDPVQTEISIQRYLKLLTQLGVTYQLGTDLLTAGAAYQARTITLTSTEIQAKLGVTLTPEFVVHTLTKLGFQVTSHAAKNSADTDYLVTVPSYRASKDISLPIDLIEELGRFYGYGNLPADLPVKAMVPHANQRVYNLRKVKQLLATVGQAHEVQTYPFFDEQWLQELKWQPPVHNAIRVQSPVSANWSRLATTLVPNLVKCVLQNLNTGATALNFFECQPVWDLVTIANAVTPVERLTLTGLWFTPHKAPATDFYRVKQVFEQLFALLQLPVRWQSATADLPVWYEPTQTAQLWHDDHLLGYFGALNPTFVVPVLNTKFSGYVCELDLDYLLDYVPAVIRFKPLSKYQSSYLDVSLMVPDSLTVQRLEQTISQAHSLITQVQLIDSFAKPEWQNQRAVTFRYKLVDQHKTMVKAEIDQAQQAVEQQLRALGATVR